MSKEDKTRGRQFFDNDQSDFFGEYFTPILLTTNLLAYIMVRGNKPENR
jgi:hypothetical protein